MCYWQTPGKKYVLPGGGVARFSTGEFCRRDGTLIEGVGITPDMPTAYTVAAFRQGCDLLPLALILAALAALV